MGGAALEGIRVVEFGTGIAGPGVCRALADFGAEVIKVETAKRPDLGRGPAPDRINKGIGFSDWNRNKLGIALDVTLPTGRELVMRLVGISDIVVENFSAGVIQKLGLDYTSLRKVNPSLIMVSLQGLGATETHSVTLGQNIPPLIGLTYLWNHPDAVKPVGSQLFHPDYYAGVVGACAVLAALEYRARTGRGQYIDASQAEAAAALLGPAYLDYTANGRVPSPMGNRSPYAAPYGCYRCQGKDRWCVIAVYTDEEWESFCLVLGRPEWLKDPAFADGLSRVRNAARLDALVEEWIRERTPEEVMEALQGVGVAAGVVQDVTTLAKDRHLWERGFLVELEHAEMGRLLFGGIPMKHSETPGIVRSPAPLLGQDNPYVFGDLLGLAAQDRERLTREGVLV